MPGLCAETDDRSSAAERKIKENRKTPPFQQKHQKMDFPLITFLNFFDLLLWKHIRTELLGISKDFTTIIHYCSYFGLTLHIPIFNFFNLLVSTLFLGSFVLLRLTNCSSVNCAGALSHIILFTDSCLY